MAATTKSFKPRAWTPPPSSIDHQNNSKLDTSVTGQAIPYDKDVIDLSATMWW